jgi:hypothetical protein
VLDALKQQGAVDDVVGPLRYGDRAQIAGDHVVVRALRVAQHAPGERLVGIDSGDRDLEAAFRELADAELAQRGEAARLEHADLLARAPQHVVANRLGEEAARCSMAARRASFGSSHIPNSS